MVIFIMGTVMSSFAQKKEFQYVGADKCKMCHKGPKNGEIFEIWLKSKHASAFTVLASEEAKAVAQKKGIADAQKDAKCLKCHVTAYDKPAAVKTATLTLAEGVSCESCHGPGSEYKSMKAMKDLAAGTIQPASVGLNPEPMKTCATCHNEQSPTFKKIDFVQAFKQIEHKVPKK